MKYNGFYKQFGLSDMPPSGLASFTTNLIFSAIGDAIKIMPSLISDNEGGSSHTAYTSSRFKNLEVRNLIFLIGDDLFWDSYERRFIYHSDFINEYSINDHYHLRQNDIDCQFNNNINLSHGHAAQARSILIRLVCIIMGVNPYKDLLNNDLLKIRNRIHFEVSKIMREFLLIEELVKFRGSGWNPEISWNKLHVTPFENILNVRSLVDPMCSLFSFSLKLKVDEERYFFSDDNLFLDPIRTSGSGGIREDDLINIWGRSKKAFKNELQARKNNEKKEEIIKYFDFDYHGQMMSLITIDSAFEWLDTKRINYDFFNQPKDRDYNYKDLEHIFYESKLTNKGFSKKIESYLNSIQIKKEDKSSKV